MPDSIVLEAVDTPTLRFTEGMRKMMHPRRAPRNGKPLTAVQIAKLFKKLCDAYTRVEGYSGRSMPTAWERGAAQAESSVGAAMSGAHSDFMRGTPPAAFDVEREAARANMLGIRASGNFIIENRLANDGKTHPQTIERVSLNEEYATTMVDFWVGAFGPAAALQALLASCGLDRRCNADEANRLESAWLIRADKPRGGYAQYPKAWRSLRGHLAECGEEVYASALEVARAARENASASVRTKGVLSYLFPSETEWARLDAEKYLETDATWRSTGKGSFALDNCVLASLADLEVATRYVERIESAKAEALLTMVEALGVAAAPMLLARFKRESGFRREGTVEALSAIVSEEVGTQLVGVLGDKAFREVVAEYFLQSPRVAVRVLSRVAPQRGKGSDPVSALLSAVVRANPDVVEALLPTLDDRQRSTLETYVEKTRLHDDEAPSDRVPTVLSSPPWLQGKPRARKVPIVGDVPMLAHPESVVWARGERERVPPGMHWSVSEHGPWKPIEPGSDDAGLLARLEQATGPYIAAGVLDLLSDDAALEALKKYPLYIDAAAKLRFLHRFGPRALDALILRDSLEELLRRFRSPRLARRAAEANMKRLHRRLAQRWMLEDPEAAAVGLVPYAVGEAGRNAVYPGGKTRDAAHEALGFLARRGHRDVILAVAARCGAPTEKAVRDLLDYDPLYEFPAKLPAMPEFWNASSLPRPLLKDGGALPLSAVEHLGTMLAFSRTDAPYAGLAVVRESCDPASLGEFAWQLFQAWFLAGAPPKEAWAFYAIGHLGNDECAKRLAPLIRAWPPQGFHSRAVQGLEILAMLGTETSLMLLHGIAQRARHAGIQGRAKELIETIAADLGLTEEELADRLVPDLGLGPDGSRTFDYGARKFKAAFDENMEPVVVDGDGRRLADLPKAAKSDDAAKAKEARAAWQEMKAEAKRTVRHHLLRLEIAMIDRRVFGAESFLTHLVRHPFMQHLVRRFVWGTSDGDGVLQTTFRVCEDGTLSDMDDRPFELAPGTRLILPHPMELGAARCRAWGTVLADYRVMQPFPQVGRALHHVADHERGSRTLDVVKGVKVPAGRILSLEQRGWRRGEAGNSGVVSTMCKRLADGEAELNFSDGWIVGDLAGSTDAEQELLDVQLPRPAGELPGVVYSELVGDLLTLREV